MVDSYIKQNNGFTPDAKDIFQQALVVFYKNCLKEEFVLSSSISTYLFSISKNLWLKELRRRKPTKNLDSSDHEILQSDEGDFSENQELMDNMMNGLNQLTDNCKKLIRLYHFEKKKWSEIVVIMNYKNDHAARNQKYKCLKKLKAIIS